MQFDFFSLPIFLNDYFYRAFLIKQLRFHCNENRALGPATIITI
jgi:hypothetical protein